MAQIGEKLVPNSNVGKETQPFIEGYLTFKDDIFNDGIEVGIKVRMTKAESKSSVDSHGKGRPMLRISNGGSTDDPRNSLSYQLYNGLIGVSDKSVTYIKVAQPEE